MGGVAAQGARDPAAAPEEACCGAHHLGRVLLGQGHDVKLIPPQYVKPFGQRDKNDSRDAEACAEACLRPTMRCVQVKSAAQLINQARAFLLEHGIALEQPPQHFQALQPRLGRQHVRDGVPVRRHYRRTPRARPAPGRSGVSCAPTPPSVRRSALAERPPLAVTGRPGVSCLPTCSPPVLGSPIADRLHGRIRQRRTNPDQPNRPEFLEPTATNGTCCQFVTMEYGRTG